MAPEWNSKEHRVNQRKRDGLDFETAARVFDDVNLVFLQDRIIEGEQLMACDRGRTCGALVVVQVYRKDGVNGEEIIRIIPPRR